MSFILRIYLLFSTFDDCIISLLLFHLYAIRLASLADQYLSKHIGSPSLTHPPSLLLLPSCLPAPRSEEILVVPVTDPLIYSLFFVFTRGKKAD